MSILGYAWSSCLAFWLGPWAYNLQPPCFLFLLTGIPFSKPKLITQLEQGKETWREERKCPMATCPGEWTQQKEHRAAGSSGRLERGAFAGCWRGKPFPWPLGCCLHCLAQPPFQIFILIWVWGFPDVPHHLPPLEAFLPPPGFTLYLSQFSSIFMGFFLLLLFLKKIN